MCDLIVCGHLYVFFRPGVEHGGDVTSIMDGDEESPVNKFQDSSYRSIRRINIRDLMFVIK